MRGEPKYRVGQVLRITHSWAKHIPPRPVSDVMWDESWQCFTYAFPASLIRIEEHRLEPVDVPDMDPDEWLERWSAEQRAERDGS